MTTPSGQWPSGGSDGPTQPDGHPDAQPWDPAYPHPYGYSSQAYQSPYQQPYAGQSGQQYGQPYGQQYGQQYGQPYINQYGQPYYPYSGYQPGYQPRYQPGYQPQQPPAAKPGRKRGLLGFGIAAAAAATVVAVCVATGATQAVSGTALGALGGSSNNGTSNGSANGGSSNGGSSNGGSSGGTSPLPGTGTYPGNGTFPFPSTGGGSGSGNSSSASTATAKQSVGVVDIVSVENFGSAEAAGTGTILTSDGRVLTNNHVIDGATSIKVTVVSTGKSYTAKVVGTAPTKDVAVLQLQNASGLATADYGDSSSVSVGDAVTGVGNAGGAGGTPSAASGKVTARNKTITASDEGGQNSETLHGVIVTDAPIQAGDSGGPLYNSSDKIIGMDTAASTSGQTVGFAIPIDDALNIAGQIEKGIQTTTIHIGYPGFLGISVSEQTTSGGALVAGVLDGGPAAKAGITGGDVITRIDGTTIGNSTQLRTAISSHKPGSQVSVTYSDQSTGSHTVTITLATGPAD